MVALYLAMAFYPLPGGAGMSFSALQPGEEAVVMYDSSGCFHHDRYRFVFKRSSDLTVKIQRIWDDGTAHTVRVAPLSEAKVVGLDHLLQFYRMRLRAGSTMVDGVTVSFISQGRVRSFEWFVDRTMQMMLEDGGWKHEAEVARLGAITWLPDLVEIRTKVRGRLAAKLAAGFIGAL